MKKITVAECLRLGLLSKAKRDISVFIDNKHHHKSPREITFGQQLTAIEAIHNVSCEELFVQQMKCTKSATLFLTKKENLGES